jgi:hypothetical protein
MLRTILWVVALFIIFSLLYKVAFCKQVEQRVNCLERSASAESASTPIAAVNKYSACIERNAGRNDMAKAGPTSAGSKSDTKPLRCKYVGTWAATRGTVTYNVTLEADGRFVAGPGENAPPSPVSITCAWSVAGNALAWAYHSGPVWPPDINPLSDESSDAFTLREVNGSTTRYTLIEKQTAAICA